MMLWITLKVALRSLWSNRLRSVLAMLGIIIGVSAVIFVLSLVAGAHTQMMSRITAMGTNLLVVTPGQRGTGGVMSGTQQNLTVEDALALRQLPMVNDAAPVVRGGGQVKYLANNSSTSIVGTSVTYFAIRDFQIAKGRLFQDQDCDSLSRVAVIGPTTAENLFGQDDAVGQVIKLRGINFRVIGVLAAKGDQGWINPDDQVIIPYTVAMKQVLGVDFLREIDLRAMQESQLTQLQEQVTQLLRKRHRLTGEMANDFSVRNQADMLDMADTFNRTLTLLAGGIAGISLLVGGIGIMNIMLVTVTERTREIGVRKAVGAKNRDILRQFLYEAVLMSGIGGLLGVLAGMGLASVVAHATSLQASVSLFSILLGLGFSSAVGVFFGFYPASRAARMDPIEALRYE